MSRRGRGSSKTKEAVILLVDIGENVSQQGSDGKSFLHKSKQSASKIIQRKIFSNADSDMGLVLIGSNETKNDLDYPNIYVEYKWLASPNWNMLRSVENLAATSVSDADWLSGLIVAINILKDEAECKKFSNLKIVLLSNLGSQVRQRDHVDNVIEALKACNISLVVIGPDLEEDENEGVPGKTKVQKKGEALVSRIIDETNGVICRFDEAMEQLDHFQKVVGTAQNWYCDLQIGNDIFIPVTGNKKFAPKNTLKWGKRSIEGRKIITETVFFEGEDQIDKSDVIKSYLFGETVVPMSEEDKAALALKTEKCFQLIGFTSKENVPRHMYLGDSVHYILPRKDEDCSHKTITALVKTLIMQDMVGIVKKVYCKNGSPRMGALIPAHEKESYFFYYVPLPYAEDERHLRLPSLRNVQPSQAQRNAVDKLIDRMNLSDFEDEGDSSGMFVNPAVEHKNNIIVYKALNPDCPALLDSSEYVKKLLEPKLEILTSASDALDEIKRLFPLEEIEQKRHRKGAADVFERKPTDMEVDDSNVNGTTDPVTSFAQSTVTEVGTIDPEVNFLKLLERGESFDKLCEQMQVAVRKLFLNSSSVIGIKKPVSALSFLRQQCISKDPLLYNEFIATLKDDFIQRGHTEFWDAVVQDDLGLITIQETEKSKVTKEEAEIFYNVKEDESQEEANYEMEAEDLLDMI